MAVPDFIEDLIYRFLMREAKEEDIIHLKALLSENLEYFDEFERICRMWHRGKYVTALETIDTEIAWQKIIKGKPAKRINKWYHWGYAASLILLLAVGGYWWEMVDMEVVTQTAVVVKPGSAKAQLILASGEKIDLGKYAPEKINESGIVIAGDTGKLIYQNDVGKKCEALDYNELVIPRGGEYCLRLSDGTEVHLNSESRLRYPVTFSGEERRVWLEGEAYFEVKKIAGKRFVVSSSEVDITVLGTKFNVTSYSNSNKVITTLVDGCVDVSVKKQPGKRSRLQPNEQAVFDNQTRELKTQEVNVLLYTAWNDGYYAFEQEPIGEIMRTLERWYDIEVVFKRSELRKVRFSGRLKRYGEISDLLSIFQLTQGIECVLEGNKIFIQ